MSTSKSIPWKPVIQCVIPLLVVLAWLFFAMFNRKNTLSDLDRNSIVSIYHSYHVYQDILVTKHSFLVLEIDLTLSCKWKYLGRYLNILPNSSDDIVMHVNKLQKTLKKIFLTISEVNSRTSSSGLALFNLFLFE